MALTNLEEKRIQDIETTLNQLKTLIKGAAGGKQLNKLLVLCNEELRRVTARQEALETQIETLTELARSLQ